MSTTVVDSEFRARLTQVLERFGSVVALANAVGVSDNAIYKWLAGRGQPSMANLVAVARAARVSVEWLATGVDHKQSRDTLAHALERGDFVFMPRNFVRIPDARSSTLESDQVVDPLAFRVEWIKSFLRAEPRDLILIKITGDAMAPTLEDGDLIITDMSEPRFRQDGIYVLRHEGGLEIKRLQRRPDGKMLIRGDNPKYQPILVEAKKLRVLGRAIWASGRI